jgi:hypothetical protein
MPIPRKRNLGFSVNGSLSTFGVSKKPKPNGLKRNDNPNDARKNSTRLLKTKPGKK